MHAFYCVHDVMGVSSLVSVLQHEIRLQHLNMFYGTIFLFYSISSQEQILTNPMDWTRTLSLSLLSPLFKLKRQQPFGNDLVTNP